MKTLHSHLAAAALLALASLPARAFTLPVAEDTYLDTASSKITAVTGASPTLVASNTQFALVRFDLTQLPAGFNAANVASATLRVHVLKAKFGAGNLVAAAVTSEWHETGVAANFPTFNPTGPLLAATPVGKSFATADVTAEIKAALSGGPNFGFVVATSTGKTVLGAKEGAGTGFPAELQIEINAPAVTENLRIVRGTFAVNPALNPKASVTTGAGYTVAYNSVGDYTVTFTTVFTEAPTVTFNVGGSSAMFPSYDATPTTTTTAHFKALGTNGAAAEAQVVHFIAIGKP